AAQHLAVIEYPETFFDPTTLPGFAAFAVVVVAWDFAYYWQHRFGHERLFFWGSHSAHHQSEDYNLSTALRQTSMGFLLVWIFDLPLFILGVPLETYVTAVAVNLIYQFWVHTQFIRRMPSWYEYIFVTPSNHRVHHAQNDLYLDRNYGGIFILWDRLFGTFQDELDREPPVFGVRKPLRSWNPFLANVQVYAQMVRDSWHTRRWRDKVWVWLCRTGWRPADVAARYPLEQTDGRHLTKFDPPVSSGAARYGLVQFVLCVVAVSVLLLRAPSLSMTAALVACVPVWLTLYSVALLNEQRGHARAVEWLRLTVLAALAAAASMIAPGALAWVIALTAPLYLLLSALWLARLTPAAVRAE
ncbi:MAG: sterol desaturase family protein, partial [Myxococcota bacterium]